MTNKSETTAKQIPQAHPALWSILAKLLEAWMEFREYEDSIPEGSELHNATTCVRSDLSTEFSDVVSAVEILLGEHLEFEIKQGLEQS